MKNSYTLASYEKKTGFRDHVSMRKTQALVMAKISYGFDNLFS